MTSLPVTNFFFLARSGWMGLWLYRVSTATREERVEQPEQRPGDAEDESFGTTQKVNIKNTTIQQRKPYSTELT